MREDRPDREYTRESYRHSYGEFLGVAAEIGLPEEVGKLIASNLRSERAIRRMTAYLRHVRPVSMEMIADEMLAIMEDRDNWIRKKQAEESSQRYNEWLNSDARREANDQDPEGE